VNHVIDITRFKQLKILSLNIQTYGMLKYVNDIEELYLTETYPLNYITDCKIDLKNMTKLRLLKLARHTNLINNCIKKLVNLKCLLLSRNLYSHDINNLSKLEFLEINDSYAPIYFSNCVNLKNVFAYKNLFISNESLQNLVNLEKLDVSYTRNVTNINHMKKLQILKAYDCDLSNNGIKDLTMLKKVYASTTDEITKR